MLSFVKNILLKSSYMRKISPIILAFNFCVSATDYANDGASFAQKMPRKESSENDIKYAKEISQQKPSFQDVEVAKQVDDQQKTHLEDLQNITKELEFVTGTLPAIGKGCKDCGSAVQNIPNKKSDMAIADRVSENGILVFVSFSMPKAALIELSDQSQKYGATLVLRGIHEDSFLKMKDKIMEISPKGLHLDIHPDLFKQYGIKRVPTFVLVKNGAEVNRLSGNVTLEFAHQKLLEEQ